MGKKTLTFLCARDNDAGTGGTLSCELELIEEGLVFKDQSWSTSGPNVDNIFSVRSGKWSQLPNFISLLNSAGTPVITMESISFASPNAPANGKLKGDGLYGGHIVDWAIN